MKVFRLNHSMETRLRQYLKLKERLLEQQSAELKDKRSRLEREFSLIDLLSELVDDAHAKAASAPESTGLSFCNTGQFKALLYEGLNLRQRQIPMIQDQCRAMTDKLLAQHKQILNMQGVLSAVRRGRARRKQRELNDEWIMRARVIPKAFC